MFKELWVDVDGFEGIYKVSNFGQIKRILNSTSTFEGKLLKPDINKSGYWRVTLYKKGKRYKFMWHEIVCVAFHGSKPDKHEVHHRDEVKGNNFANNLEWVTSRINKQLSGRRNYFPRKTYRFTSPFGEQFIYSGLSEFCSKHDLDKSAMSAVAKGKNKSHKGWSCIEV